MSSKEEILDWLLLKLNLKLSKSQKIIFFNKLNFSSLKFLEELKKLDEQQNGSK